MSMHIAAVGQKFVGFVSGIDLRAPLGTAGVDEITRGLDRYGVLVFPGQPLSQDELIRFGMHFGALDAQKNTKIMSAIQQRLASTVVHDISNVDKSGNVADVNDAQSIMNVTNTQWHTDGAYQHYPARYSILSAVTAVTWNGHTQFASLYRAYDTLDERTKAMIQNLVGIFYSLHTRMQMGVFDAEEVLNAYPPVRWPLVRTHLGSGRRVLWVDKKLCKIEGMSIPEGRALADELIEHATESSRVYSHAWTPGDLVMYDNRSCLHRGRRFDRTERREMRRVQVLDDAPSMGYVTLDEALPRRALLAAKAVAMSE